MSVGIDRMCDQLRIKLHGIDRRLEVLKAKGMAISEKSMQAVESQLAIVERRIGDNRVIVEAANARVKSWTEERKISFADDRAGWEIDRQAAGNEGRLVHRLAKRADDAEAYAVAVFELAAAAADEAVQAALQALLARQDADMAALPKSCEVR
jgi:hypothetical protein